MNDNNLTDEEAAFAHIAGVLDEWVKLEQLQGTAPLVAAAKLLQVLTDVLQEGIGRSAVRAALLMTYEKTHEKPMDFTERAAAMKMLDQIVQARNKVEGRPSLILPGAGDAQA